MLIDSYDLFCKREEGELDENGDDQDCEAEIADKALDQFEQPEQRLGEEIEPAPVDHQIEAFDVVFLADRVDGVYDLGAGEKTVLIGRLAARGDRYGLLCDIVGLVYIEAVLASHAERSLQD